MYVGAIKISVLVITLFLLSCSYARAAETPTIQSLQTQIGALLKEVSLLKKQLDIQSQSAKANESVDTIPGFSSFLQKGTRGKEVEHLQKFLAFQTSFYPEKQITGFFGALTEIAVKNFQQANKIEPVGWVGPKTRQALNFLLEQKKKEQKDARFTQGFDDTRTQNFKQSVIISTTTRQVLQELNLNDITQFEIRSKPAYDFSVLEFEIHNLINQKRLEHGIAPLFYDQDLENIANAHSAEQALDNKELTDPAIPCSYPIIRHEGFSGGFSLKDRFDAYGYNFRRAGENIGVLPLTKNMVYQYDADEPKPSCPKVRSFDPAPGTFTERKALYEEIFLESLKAARSLPKVVWVNQDWYTLQETAQRIVKGWMDSEGHRKNILTSEFTFGGIGIAEVNNYLIITHNFAQK